MKKILPFMVVSALCLAGVIPAGAAAFGKKPIRTKPAASDLAAHRRSDRILVKFKRDVTDARRAEILAPRGMRVGRSIEKLGYLVIDLPNGVTPESAMQNLQSTYGGDVEAVQLDYLLYPDVVHPNDPLYAFQYHHFLMHASEAWDSTKGSGISIGIADSGVDTHVDLTGNLTSGRNVVDDDVDTSDTDSHGTLVAGSAAAVGNNALGVAGVAYEATIVPLKITHGGSASTLDIAEAIVWAADHGVRVVNVSYSSALFCDTGGITAAAADYIRRFNGWVVKSAGNSGFDKGCSNDHEIIVVSATDEFDDVAGFTNFGNEVDISAPGVDIVTTDLGHTYSGVNGTSFSAPIVAGALAMIYAVDSFFTSDQALQILVDSADDLGAPGYDIYYGWGRVNTQRAMTIAAERSITFRRNSLSNVYVYPSPWDVRRHGTRQVTFANLPDTAKVDIYTLSGMSVMTLRPESGRAVWDLRNRGGEEVAAGLYFYSVASGTGAHSKGKFAIIK